MDRVKHLVKLFERIPDPTQRTFDDLKEVVELIKKLPWFHKLGRHFREEDALELAKSAQIKRIDLNKMVQSPKSPHNIDNNYYFILKGKVAVGIECVYDNRNNFFITSQNSIINQFAN